MPASETIAATRPHQARTRAGMGMEAMDRQAGCGRDNANCGFCGHAWFGEVAYCPFCGHPSTPATAATGADAPPAAESRLVAPMHAGGPAREAMPQRPDRPPSAPLATVPPELEQERVGARADPQGIRWKARWKPIAAAAASLALVVVAVKEFTVTTNDGARVQTARRALPVDAAATSRTSPSTPQPPPAEPVAHPADIAPPGLPKDQAPPAPPNRSLCSVPNEVAGLCKPQ